MTKQLLSVSTIKVSRVCRWLLTLGICKILFLITMFSFPEPQKADHAKDRGSLAVTNLDNNLKTQTEISQSEKKLSEILPNALTMESSLAYAESATSLPLTTSVMPPAPKIPNSAEGKSFFSSEQPLTTSSRPDEATSTPAPAPKVSPFVPKDSLQRKQEEINRREQELLALQQQMDARLNELHILEEKIQKMLDQANGMQDKKVAHLVDVYSNMKAKQAADVLATLDKKIAVKILAGMRGKQAGEILTYMAPEPAAKLSELLSKTQLP